MMAGVATNPCVTVAETTWRKGLHLSVAYPNLGLSLAFPQNYLVKFAPQQL